MWRGETYKTTKLPLLKDFMFLEEAGMWGETKHKSQKRHHKKL